MASLQALINKTLVSIVPAHSQRVYRWCKQYVDHYNGENNDQIETNGELRLMQRNLPQCRMVFDVGANVGTWAALALKINPRLDLHCFEPSHVTYQQLISNHFPQNVRCNNFGIGSAPGEAKLFIFENAAGINSLYQREGLQSFGLSTPQRTETVHLETIDNYCQGHRIEIIDFLKVDVEGHEMEVFKGAERMLSSGCVNIIQFEYGGCNIDAGVLLKDIFNFFKPLSYSFFKIYPQELRSIATYDQGLENFQYQNWAFVRNGYSFQD
jgi:FkbM family methyltransferase